MIAKAWVMLRIGGIEILSFQVIVVGQALYQAIVFEVGIERVSHSEIVQPVDGAWKAAGT